MQDALFLVAFPIADNPALHWWHVSDGNIIARGCDADPLFAAGLKPSVDEAVSYTFITLMPASAAVVRWHSIDGDYTEKQAQAAAILEARLNSLQADNLHIAAVSNGHVATAAVGRDVMASGLALLQALGLDPDIIMPSGWLVPPVEGQVIQADLGFERVLRAERMIAPDEPFVREKLVGDAKIAIMNADAIDDALIRALDSASPNLRSGIFAKKPDAAMTLAQKRLLGWVAVALIVVSILIPVVQLAKYHWAASTADEAALAAAKPVLGTVNDPETAEHQLNERLITDNRGNVMFSIPASALFSALQQTPDVSAGPLSYRNDGTVSAELSAVRNEDINPVLIALQNAGFVITVTPRTDATGVVKAAVTVRAP